MRPRLVRKLQGGGSTYLHPSQKPFGGQQSGSSSLPFLNTRPGWNANKATTSNGQVYISKLKRIPLEKPQVAASDNTRVAASPNELSVRKGLAEAKSKAAQPEYQKTIKGLSQNQGRYTLRKSKSAMELLAKEGADEEDYKAVNYFDNGINAAANKIRMMPGFEGLTQDEIDQIATIALRNGWRESKNGVDQKWYAPAVDFLDEYFPVTLNAAVAIARGKNPFGNSEDDGTLSNVYKRNRDTYLNRATLNDHRDRGIRQGVSLGAGQIKAVDQKVPTYFTNGVENETERDAMNTFYVTAKLWNALKNRPMYMTTGNQKIYPEFGIDPDKHKGKIQRGPEMTMGEKIRLFYNQGGVPTTSDGQTLLQRWDGRGGRPDGNLKTLNGMQQTDIWKTNPALEEALPFLGY